MEGKRTPFMFTRAAHIIPTITATTSALFSLLVLTIIGRSWLRHSDVSTYHLIIVIMSATDVITSVPMAFTTLPMPADVRQYYPYASKSYGTTATCELQGFLISFGCNMGIGSFCILCAYYVSVIRFGVMAETFKKRALPILFCFFFALTFSFSCVILSRDYLNPMPHEPYCLVGPYPVGCKESEGDPNIQECVRGHPSGVVAWSKFKIPYFAAFLLIFVFVVISLFSVVSVIFSMEKEGTKNGVIGEETDVYAGSARRSETRVVVRQAVMYIAAFVSTWIAYLMTAIASGKGSLAFYNTVDPLKVTLMPLQGFFNAAIFVYHEIYAIRKTQTLSILEALRKVLWSPYEVPNVLVSRIEMVDADNFMNQMVAEDLGNQRMQDSDVLSRQESQLHSESEKEISSASIPSDFVSANTPSLNLSLALSENEHENKVDVGRSFDGPSGSRQYTFYTEYTDKDSASTSCSHSKVTEKSRPSSSPNGNQEYSLNSKKTRETNDRGLDVGLKFPIPITSDQSQGTNSAYSRISRGLFALEEDDRS